MAAGDAKLEPVQTSAASPTTPAQAMMAKPRIVNRDVPMALEREWFRLKLTVREHVFAPSALATIA